MLQISNMDDGKAEWNINETHIIIPMIDGDVTNKDPDKILTNTLTLNSLEGGDQTILTNALENSLVIGLDKSLFETPNYRSDLVIIQNSDLKLFSCNSDLKNPVAYTLSYMDQDKSEILWQTPISKDRIRSDKAILGVRDVLNYDDCVNSELEKSQQQINLASIDPDIASQVTKTSSEILTIGEQKKESQFITFYSSSQNSEVDVILPHLNTSKLIENVQGVENKKIFENGHYSETDSVEPAYKLEGVTDKNILNLTKSVVEISDSAPVKLIECAKHKTDKKTANRSKETKDLKVEGTFNIEGVSSLPEKSLPLKKKAKMKRTVVSYASENRMSLLKHDMVASHVNAKFPLERNMKKPLTLQKQDYCDSSESSVNKGLKRKKSLKFKTNPKKSQNSIPDPAVQEDKDEVKKPANNSLGEGTLKKINFCNFDRNEFNSIYDLVECLRKCRMINGTVWQTLNSGLKEMKVDILKEMNAKINEDYSPHKTQYSPQLKAFALVLYFKQPAAFNHLSQVYKTGWPSLNVIKEWKRQINSHQGSSFIRTEKDVKNNKP